jgi:hypothetical protein
MTELPIDLKKLQPVPGAFEVLRYLLHQPGMGADGDALMDALGMSSRRWDKAKRRLVTTGYLQMRNDYSYGLTNKGRESAQILEQVGDSYGSDDSSKIQRQVMLALPRNLVSGQVSPLRIGFEPITQSGEAQLVLRLQALHADLGNFEESFAVSSDAHVIETTVAPQQFDQVRLRLEVYQLSTGGDDLNACGGMYVDVDVLPSGSTGEMIAYGIGMEFDAV